MASMEKKFISSAVLKYYAIQMDKILSDRYYKLDITKEVFSRRTVATIEKKMLSLAVLKYHTKRQRVVIEKISEIL